MRRDFFFTFFNMGRIFQHAGSDSALTFRELFLAGAIAYKIPEFRSIVYAWLRDRKLFRAITLDTLIREIITLGLIKSSQSGLGYANQGFHTRALIDQDASFLTLTSVAADPNAICLLTNSIASPSTHSSDFWIEVEKAIRNKRISGIRLDVSAVLPSPKGDACAMISYAAKGQTLRLRSQPDQYFYFPTLTALLIRDCSTALYAIRMALSPAYGPDHRALVRAFEGGSAPPNVTP